MLYISDQLVDINEVTMPKIVDKDSRRMEIAKAAIDVLSAKGFERTTIQEIADAAGIGKGTIYEYFKSKEEIIIYTGNALFDSMFQSVDTAFNNLKTPGEKLQALADSMISMVDQMQNIFIVYIELWLVYLRKKRYGGSLLLLNESLVKIRKMVSEILDEGKKAKQIMKDIDTESAAIFLVASLDGLAMHYYLDNSFDIRKVCRTFLYDYFQGISA
jgi:AcrR family transcriptional regulator